MKMQKLALALLLATPLISFAAPPVMVSSGMLTGSNGMTLYVLTKDTPGVSTGRQRQERLQ